MREPGTGGRAPECYPPASRRPTDASKRSRPPEIMPDWLIEVMKITPTPHFVSFSQSVLYRAASLDIVWPQLGAVAAITTVYFGISMMRFRTTIASFQWVR